jgi:vacuolar-type H+-ATPase subunit I/STV1
MRFVGHIIDNKETIKAYISGLNNRVLLMLLKDGHKFKETKKLAKWQQVAETAVIKCEEKVGLESTTEKTKLVRLPLQKLKEFTIWNQMKRLTKANRKQIIEETTIKFLDGEELISIIRRLNIDTMYITKKKSLKLPLEFITYQGKEEVVTLVDSGTTDNFIDFRTVAKLCLGTRKIPKARQLYNVDGTHN